MDPFLRKGTGGGGAGRRLRNPTLPWPAEDRARSGPEKATGEGLGLG
jgi:hypothetical protein